MEPWVPARLLVFRPCQAGARCYTCGIVVAVRLPSVHVYLRQHLSLGFGQQALREKERQDVEAFGYSSTRSRPTRNIQVACETVFVKVFGWRGKTTLKDEYLSSSGDLRNVLNEVSLSREAECMIFASSSAARSRPTRTRTERCIAAWKLVCTLRVWVISLPVLATKLRMDNPRKREASAGAFFG